MSRYSNTFEVIDCLKWEGGLRKVEGYLVRSSGLSIEVKARPVKSIRALSICSSWASHSWAMAKASGSDSSWKWGD